MAAPTVTALSPASGPTAGATVVSITGTGMAAATAVAFGATPASDFAIMSATQVVAIAPAGTSIVHVTVTNGDGTSATSAADYYQFTDGLFTVAEARAYDKGQLADAGKFSSADIIAKEAEIREFLTDVCAVDFVPTVHTDEYHSGDSGRWLMLKWPLVTAISAASTRSDTTWTALTADELADVQIDPDGAGLIYREGSYWPAGVRNIKLTYTAGHTTVPDAIKDAALKIAVTELPTSNVPFAADSYDANGMAVTFNLGDGFQGRWHRIPEVQRAIRLYSRKLPGIA